MKEKNFITSLLIPVGVSLLAAIISGAVLLLTLTGVAYATEDYDRLVIPLSLTALAISTLVCGVVSAKLCDTVILPPVLSALISGVALAILLFLMSVIPVSSGADLGTGIKAFLYCAVAGVCTLGGVIGKPKVKKRPKYPRRMRR